MIELAVDAVQITQTKALGNRRSAEIRSRPPDARVASYRHRLFTAHNRQLNKSMEIQTKDYTIEYDRATQTITCCGSFRLRLAEEYAPIVELLKFVVDSSPNTITLDLRKLEFLNSSGINILSKFAIEVRQQKNIQMTVKGSKQIPWQGKFLKNLQRLMPSLHLELE